MNRIATTERLRTPLGEHWLIENKFHYVRDFTRIKTAIGETGQEHATESSLTHQPGHLDYPVQFF